MHHHITDMAKKTTNKSNGRYVLEKYKSKQSRYTCPGCGKPRCFTRYIDTETGKYVHETVGRCDHEQSCGYNLTPYEWKKSRYDWEDEPKKIREMQKPKPKEVIYVPKKYTGAAMNAYSETTFFKWLASIIEDLERLYEVCLLYQIGASTKDYRDPAVIFWQIDRFGNVHDGKLMWYGENGHRSGAVNWVVTKMAKQGILFPAGYSSDKVFFGEHLTAVYKEETVCVVESEKSAVVCACLFPQYLCLASGGCGGLNANKLRCLSGRKVIVIPDAGEAEKWRKQVEADHTFYFAIADWIDRYPKNTDLVDILIDKVLPTDGEPVDVSEEIEKLNNQLK